MNVLDLNWQETVDLNRKLEGYGAKLVGKAPGEMTLRTAVQGYEVANTTTVATALQVAMMDCRYKGGRKP